MVSLLAEEVETAKVRPEQECCDLSLASSQ
jgi:hypothetical protein